MNTNLCTYQDIVDELLDLYGEDFDRRAKRNARRAARDAYRSLTVRHDWSIYSGLERISTMAKYDTGTIAYDHTGGDSERLVTLTDGTFPSWASYGVLQISGRNYDVETNPTTTTLTLTEALNPGADVVAGTSYTLFRDTYPLPVNIRRIGQLRDLVDGYEPDFIYPEDWGEVVRCMTTPSLPTHYTILGEPENYSSMAVRFAPPPDAVYVYDFDYHRGLAQLRTLKDTAGTATTSTTTVTASTSVFKDWHVGCMIRFGDTTNEPTGFGGEHPYQYQRVITAVSNDTTATIDSALPTEVEAVYYTISDVLDIETDVMYGALMAEARARYAAMTSRGKLVVDRDLAVAARALRGEAEAEYIKAKAADDKSSAGGRGMRYVPPLSRPFVVAGS